MFPIGILKTRGKNSDILLKCSLYRLIQITIQAWLLKMLKCSDCLPLLLCLSIKLQNGIGI